MANGNKPYILPLFKEAPFKPRFELLNRQESILTLQKTKTNLDKVDSSDVSEGK